MDIAITRHTTLQSHDNEQTRHTTLQSRDNEQTKHVMNPKFEKKKSMTKNQKKAWKCILGFIFWIWVSWSGPPSAIWELARDLGSGSGSQSTVCDLHKGRIRYYTSSKGTSAPLQTMFLGRGTGVFAIIQTPNGSQYPSTPSILERGTAYLLVYKLQSDPVPQYPSKLEKIMKKDSNQYFF